jgi:hypothetical protein
MHLSNPDLQGATEASVESGRMSFEILRGGHVQWARHCCDRLQESSLAQWFAKMQQASLEVENSKLRSCPAWCSCWCACSR